MLIRDRIKELRRVRAGDLRPNPRNWRLHPEPQRNALLGVLAEIGYANALLARELPDGTLELIDGHLRAETAPDQMAPVLVLDVTEKEARQLLVTLDPLGALAERDEAQLQSLLAEVSFASPAVQQMLEQLGQSAAQAGPAPEPDPAALGTSYQVAVECGSEDEQRQLYERLTSEGFRCRVLTL